MVQVARTDGRTGSARAERPADGRESRGDPSANAELHGRECREFSQQRQLERALFTEVYFANPYPSWERGSSKNTNGLLRQFFPRNRDLSRVTDEKVEAAVRLWNQRPRKCLGYQTLEESLREELVAPGD